MPSVFAAAVIAYLALCAWMFLGQRSQIYLPTPRTRIARRQAAGTTGGRRK